MPDDTAAAGPRGVLSRRDSVTSADSDDAISSAAPGASAAPDDSATPSNSDTPGGSKDSAAPTGLLTYRLLSAWRS